MTMDELGNEVKEVVEEEIELEEGEEPVRIGLKKDGGFLKKINVPYQNVPLLPPLLVSMGH